MKRTSVKALGMTAAAVISATVLAATAFAAATNVSGYEALKQSGFAAIEQYGNVTFSISAELIADGEQVFSMSQFAQTNEEQNARFTRNESSVIGEEKVWHENYQSGSASYSTDSYRPDTYSMSTGTYRVVSHNDDFTDNQKKLAGILIDLFVGDIKNYFVMDGDTVSVSLSRNQIPELIQSMLAVGAEEAVKEVDQRNYINNNDTMENIIFKYLYDPVIDSGSMTATLSGGYPADINATVNLSGKDNAGGLHNATLNINMSFSDIGCTNVKTFDPQGYSLSNAAKEITADSFIISKGDETTETLEDSLLISNGDNDFIINLPEQGLDNNIEIHVETLEN